MEHVTHVAPETKAATRVAAPVDLRKYAWLSIAAALATIFLKGAAWQITGSVGLLSDAAESLVNLVAAVVALIALTVAMRPPDKNHHFGHSKAEYFSAGTEGLMIIVAAGVIIVSSVQRFLAPQPLEQVGVGLLISVVASVINGLVGMVLIRVGRAHRSMTLVADGKHLWTDVVTSIGVIIGVGLVWVTKWDRLDAIVAFAVAINILFTGWKLLRDSTEGLMDISLPKEQNALLRDTLDRFRSEEIDFHAYRTRESGHRRFMECHMLVPGEWTVQQGHDAIEDITDALHEVMPELRVLIHLEPIEDPRSYEDIEV
ncbi:cation transporter [Tessaracoccus sp. SD287]|uniref:cation diffusion facilitator family transporter n=1 Tax=Tessaracoccus sp. SD287 TaxID=2782008 RepID=UPI001A972AA0|nr:cation transporter [Tessaracoccus sp. SD287]